MPELPSSNPGSTVEQSNISRFERADDVADFFKDDAEVLDDKSKIDLVEPEADEKIDLKEDDEGEEVDKKDKKADKEDKEEESEEESDEKEIKVEAPPRKKQILAKYPKFFDEFPFMEKMLYRDRQYTELFGSFDDAKELHEKAEVFNNFESQLLQGDTVELLTDLKETDRKAFDKLVDNYLPNLAKVDKEAYFEIVGNISKRIIVDLKKESDRLKNSDLKDAADILAQFMFGETEVGPPKPRVAEKKEDDELESERKRALIEKFEDTRDDLQTRVDNTVRATISEYIDPRGNMTDYIKKNAVNDALKYAEDMVTADPNVQRTLNKLWKEAQGQRYSRSSVEPIRAFYLGKMKQVLPSAIKRARNEALKGSNSSRKTKEDNDDDTVERPSRQRTVNSGRPSSPNNKPKMEKGESVADFFARD